MSKAIDIAANMKKLLALVETGEMSAEDIADTLEGEGLELADKLDATMSAARYLEGQAAIVAEEIARLTARKKSFDGQAKSVKAYILQCLITAEQKTLKTEFNTFTVRKGATSLVIDNVDDLPDEYVSTEVKTTADNKKVKAALEAGENIKGAHLETGPESLQVR